MIGMFRVLVSRRGLLAATMAAALVAPVNIALGESRVGGDITIALPAAPTNTDPHLVSTANDVRLLQHVYEQLITMGENYEPVLQLAESYEQSEDGRVHTFKLRDDVLFHDGSVMTSRDVLASFERHKEISPVGETLLGDAKSMSAPDEETFRIELNNPNFMFIELLKSPRYPVAILPAEDRGAAKGENSGIGTGPFRLTDFVRDSHAVIERFEDYSVDERQDTGQGLGGQRKAYLDSVTFRFVSEASARVSGLLSGELDVAPIPPTSKERVEQNAEHEVVLVFPNFQLTMAVNGFQHVTDNPTAFRKALQAAVDVDELLNLSFEGVYRRNHSLQYPGSTFYPGDVTSDIYDQDNPERVKELLEEAGYNGEEVVLLTNAQYAYHRDTILAYAEQLKRHGINARVEIVDWPTSLSMKRNREELWHVTTSTFGTQPLLGPQQWQETLYSYAFFESDPIIDEGYRKFYSARTDDERREAWTEIEKRIYDQVYFIKVGDVGDLIAVNKDLEGFEPYYIPRYWNVWLNN